MDFRVKVVIGKSNKAHDLIVYDKKKEEYKLKLCHDNML